MKKTLAFMAMCAVMTMVGCGGSSNASTGTTETPNKPPNVPMWFVQTPSEPGKAFYGVGTGSYKTSTAMQLALTSAQQAARRQIADTMKVTIQAVFKRYMQQVTANTGEVFEEGLTQDAVRAVTDFALSGAEIVKTDYGNPENGLTPIYCLARIGFDSVAQNLHKEASKAVEQVRKNADNAFAEMDKLLKEEHEKNAPAKPAPADLPPLK